MSHLSTGRDDFDGCHPFDHSDLEERRLKQGLTISKLASKVGHAVKEILRMTKYGVCHESVLPAIAKVLQVGDVKDLLPPESATGVGVRIEKGEQFL